MNEKLSFQNITEALAQRAGVQKKVSETFTKAFFDTIVEALYMGEDTIKVKGLGIFKLVEVGSRESVNVSNGERIIIPGYKKVSFTPEDSVVEFLNQNSTNEELSETTETEPVETIEESDATSSSIEIEIEKEEIEVTLKQPEPEETPDADATINIDDILQVAEPERVEMPQDEFAGIDMLISTPESIDEVRQQLADATAKMDEAVEAARKAVEDKRRLQKLLERLEANALPESIETDNTPGDDALSAANENVAEEQCVADAEEDTEDAPEMVAEDALEEAAEDVPEEATEAALSPEIPMSAPAPENIPDEDEEDRRNRAFERVMKAPKEDEKKDTSSKRRRTRIVWIISVAVILLAAIIFFLYRIFISIDAVKLVPLVPEETTPNVESPEAMPANRPSNQSGDKKPTAAPKDTLGVSTQTAEKPHQQSLPVEDVIPSRPLVYVMKKGESLTLISQRFYGTKDSVRAIIRVNDFIDPNNVPIGAKVKLP